MKRYFYAWLVVGIVGSQFGNGRGCSRAIYCRAGIRSGRCYVPKGLSSATRQEAVRSAQARVRAALESKNAQVLASIGTVMNALIVKADDPTMLQNTPGVAHVYPVRLYKKLLDRVAVIHKVNVAGDWIGGV